MHTPARDPTHSSFPFRSQNGDPLGTSSGVAPDRKVSDASFYSYASQPQSSQTEYPYANAADSRRLETATSFVTDTSESLVAEASAVDPTTPTAEAGAIEADLDRTPKAERAYQAYAIPTDTRYDSPQPYRPYTNTGALSAYDANIPSHANEWPLETSQRAMAPDGSQQEGAPSVRAALGASPVARPQASGGDSVRRVSSSYEVQTE